MSQERKRIAGKSDQQTQKDDTSMDPNALQQLLVLAADAHRDASGVQEAEQRLETVRCGKRSSSDSLVDESETYLSSKQ